MQRFMRKISSYLGVTMNILVYNVAAEYAGALTILKSFYEEVLSCRDKSHKWYFVVSTDELKECDNVKIIRVPWAKKSWLHRWWYDKFRAKKLVEQYDIDLVFSMQNMPIEGVRCQQIVYLQQSLQFSSVRFSLLKREERMYWVRQNIICNLMKKSLKNADSIIVQTKWMQEATKKWLNDTNEKINVLAPKIHLKDCCEELIEREKGLFVYPAGDGIHKNHRLIIKACEILKEMGVAHRVLFTLDINESYYANKLYLEVKQKGLNIDFVGLLSNEEIMRLYKKATLVFPSYLETFGLPLLESKVSGGLVLCSDLPFAHEILDDYSNAYFFDMNNAGELADYMEKCVKNIIKPNENIDVQESGTRTSEKTLVECVLQM